MSQLSLKKWWKKGFGEAIYPIDEIFKTPQWIHRTKNEIDFLKKVLKLKNQSILDVCCGVGRHSIPLAKLGCSVTGLDISKKYLSIATQRAKKLKINAQFKYADARNIKEPAQYDIALNLFSSLGYFLDIKDDHKIIRGIYNSLKPRGLLVLEIYNSSRLLHVFDFCQKHHWPTSVWTKTKKNGLTVLANPTVDKKQHAFINEFLFVDKNGNTSEMKTFNRIFILKDLSRLLEKNHFKIKKIYGGLDGSKYDNLKSENLVLIAQKI